MTSTQKTILRIGGWALVALLALGTPGIIICGGMAIHARTGRVYMDSLTAEDIPKWIARADALLAKYDHKTRAPRDFPIPDDLKVLKIVKIDIYPPDYVGFMWLGGMDHTGLIVQKMSNGVYTVTARYLDGCDKQLWPK